MRVEAANCTLRCWVCRRRSGFVGAEARGLRGHRYVHISLRELVYCILYPYLKPSNRISSDVRCTVNLSLGRYSTCPNSSTSIQRTFVSASSRRAVDLSSAARLSCTGRRSQHAAAARGKGAEEHGDATRATRGGATRADSWERNGTRRDAH